MNSRNLLERFDVFLEERGVGFEAIVVGGAALNLLGVISRATKDCDVLDPEIPPAVATAARAFAAEVRKTGETLQDDWLNNGPRSLAVDLPPEWREQIRPIFVGKKLRLQTLGRKDLLRVKLFCALRPRDRPRRLPRTRADRGGTRACPTMDRAA
jgi:Nucleotidyltransferase of unknown function (DUF6036)